MSVKCVILFLCHVSVGLSLVSTDNNICEVKLFNEVNFRGNNIGITNEAIGHDFRFNDVQSLEIIGPCCWQIKKSERKKALLKPGTKLENIQISLPFVIKRKICPKIQGSNNNNKLINYLYMGHI